MAVDPRKSSTAMAVVTAAVMIGQQVGAKATRDALFLGSYPATDLPKIMIAAALVGGVAVFALSSGYARWTPARLVPWVFGLNGTLFFFEWWFAYSLPAAVAVMVYLHVAMLGAAVISGFWSIVNERYDPHTARRAVARITAGAALGGVLGAVVTERVSAILDVQTMLLALAGFNAGCAVLVRVVGRGLRTMPAQAPKMQSSIETLQRSPYLQRIALLVALISIVGTLLDFAFKAEAAATLTTEAALASFFAIFYTATSIGGFVLQATASSRSLNRLGVERTLAILPWTVMALSLAGVAFARLWTVALVRGAESALEGSLFRSGYELLYVPVPAEQKRPTKVIIDVGFRRAGDLVGSGAALFVVGVLPHEAIVVVLALAGLLALALSRSVRKVYRGYVDQLVAGLETGSIDKSETPVLDPTTRRLVSQTLMIDRERLLARVAEFAGPDGSEEVSRIRRELKSGSLDPERVPWAIGLLGRRELSSEVNDALSAVAPTITGQLVDALLDPSKSSAVRRHIPDILAKAEPERAAEGLVRALEDTNFLVRSASGNALATLIEQHAELGFSKRHIFGLIEAEIDAGKQVWDTEIRRAGPSAVGGDEDLIIDPTQRGLDHVFLLLGFVTDAEALRLARRALGDPESAIRGTALEYLENVLPDSIRSKLWPYVGGQTKRSRGARTREQLVEELRSLR